MPLETGFVLVEGAGDADWLGEPLGPGPGCELLDGLGVAVGLGEAVADFDCDGDGDVDWFNALMAELIVTPRHRVLAASVRSETQRFLPVPPITRS